jgi:ferredoxin/flavodoxin---NADP+ reductase
MAKPILDATLTKREHLTDTLDVLEFELEGGVPDFKPGQFVTLGLPDPEPKGEGKMVWRAYSIASAPSEKRHVELYIRWARTPVDGKLTTMLWKMPLGGKIKHRGTTGAFTIEDERPDGSPDNRRLLLLGGGTGLAPFVSYARELQRRGAARELIICHGASYVEELGYSEELSEMHRATASAGKDEFRLRYVPAISRPDEAANAGWGGQVGRVESLITCSGEGRSKLEELLDSDLTPEEFFCHVCGYANTVKTAEASLAKRGFLSRRNRRADGSYDLKVESYG